MFNIEDTKLIMSIINQRVPDDCLLFPVCIKVDKNYYGIPEFDELDVTGSNIKIVFGTSDNVFIHNKFPKNVVVYLDNVNKFTYFDEDKQVTTEYYFFESDRFDGLEDEGFFQTVYDKTFRDVFEEINKWCDILLPYIKNIIDRNRKKAIQKMMENQ